MKYTSPKIEKDCWHKWFAWHPVEIHAVEYTDGYGQEVRDRKMVWLEPVLRKEVCNGYDWWYIYAEIK